jgi:hypothetical protein
LFAGKEIEPSDDWLRYEHVAVEEVPGPEGVRTALLESTRAEAAFDFVQRLTGEYAKIMDGDHKSIKRILQRAYLAALKMQAEPDEFARLKDDPFWSFPKPTDASSSRWVVYFIMQARRPSARHLAARYTAILDRLLRDKVSPMAVRVARMEGVEAAYESWRRQRRVRELKS